MRGCIPTWQITHRYWASTVQKAEKLDTCTLRCYLHWFTKPSYINGPWLFPDMTIQFSNAIRQDRQSVRSVVYLHMKCAGLGIKAYFPRTMGMLTMASIIDIVSSHSFWPRSCDFLYLLFDVCVTCVCAPNKLPSLWSKALCHLSEAFFFLLFFSCLIQKLLLKKIKSRPPTGISVPVYLASLKQFAVNTCNIKGLFLFRYVLCEALFVISVFSQVFFFFIQVDFGSFSYLYRSGSNIFKYDILKGNIFPC